MVDIQQGVTADGKSLNSKNADSKYNDPEYIRVSDVLKVIAKGKRMEMWFYKFKSYAEKEEALRASAERGSLVDNAIKELLRGKPMTVSEELQPFMDAFKKWQSEWSFRLIVADQEVSDDTLKYVGTLDMYGELRSKKQSKTEHVVIDIKTGVPGRGKEGQTTYEVYPSMEWQTAAYAHAQRKALHKVDGTYILRLFSDGNYVFKPDSDPKKSFEVFKHALAIRRLIGKII